MFNSRKLINGFCSSFVLAIAIGVFGSTTVTAADAVLGIGLDSGGVEMLTVPFTDGSTGSLSSGDGLYAWGGVVFPLREDELLLSQITVGVKGDSINATNGTIKFSRWPIDLLVMRKIKFVRLGAGITYHLNPELEGTGVASQVQADFDNALGFIVEFAVLFGKHAGVSLRHTNIDYTVSGTSVEIEGNNTGFAVFFGF